MARTSGFFLGGMAEGMRSADEMALKSRDLDIKEEALAGSLQRQLSTDLDKTIQQNVETITGIIQESRKAGASPDQIRTTIAPLLQSFQQLSQRTGRDIGPSLQKFDALISIPAGAESPPEPKTEVGKTRADVKAGFITPEEGAARVNRLTREEGAINVVENIRRKIATGQPLSPGEQKVYDEAINSDPMRLMMRILMRDQGPAGGGTGGLPPLPGGR